jgi:hypothetical protein
MTLMTHRQPNALVISNKFLSRVVITLLPNKTFLSPSSQNPSKTPQNLHRFALCFGPKKPTFSPTFASKLAKTALKHGEKHRF